VVRPRDDSSELHPLFDMLIISNISERGFDMSVTPDRLIQKIQSPPDKINEVEHFVDSISERRSPDDLHEAIAAYAARNEGGPEDLDRDFEAAAIEHWLEVKIP